MVGTYNIKRKGRVIFDNSTSLNLRRNYFYHCCKAQLIFVEIVLLLNCNLYLIDALTLPNERSGHL